MVRTLLGFLCIALACSHLLASNPYYVNFGTENGLPSSEVYSIAFDELGMPWFATDRGVCRYNGYDFETFTSRDGLSNNTCLDIEKGMDGRLWFAGLDGSLSFLEDGKIVPFEKNEITSNYQSLMIGGMAWETPTKFYFWYWPHNAKGVYMYDSETGNFQLLDEEDLEKAYETKIMGEAAFIRIGNDVFPPFRTPNVILGSNGIVYHDVYNKSGLLGSGSWEHPETYAIYDLGVVIHGLYMDPNENLWVASSDGVLMFPGGDLQAEPNIYFTGISFSSIMQDREGNFWLASLERGIFLVPSLDFHKVDLPVASRKSTTISSIVAMQDYLFFSALEGRIFAMNKAGKVDLLIDSMSLFGRLGYGSHTGNQGFIGNTFIKEEDGKASVERRSFIDSRSFTIKLQNGHILQAGLPGFVVRMDYNGAAKNFVSSSGRKGFTERVHSCLETTGKLWLGTLHGLYYIDNYDYANPIFVGEGSTFLSSRINDLKADGQGNIWIATIGEGLGLYNGKQVIQITVEDGLSSNMVNRLALGEDGELWAATNLGLNRIRFDDSGDFRILAIDCINTEDGLPGNFVQDVAYWNGLIWLATNDGLLSFSSEMLDERVLPRIPIIMEEVTVNRKPADPDAEISLDFDENDLSFQFLAMSMRKPRGQPFYRYRLSEGNSPAPWEYTSERIIRYLDLVPGDYLFEAAAQNRLGEWSEEAAQFKFSIQPHFTATRWFQGLMVLTALGLVLGFTYLRIQQVRQKAEARRRLQEARFKMQEAEIMALRNQMNPHFVFNALNSIQNFIFRNDPRKASHYLGRFAKLMRDGLQFSRNKLITLDEELDFLRAYLDLEKMRFPDRFDYKLEVDEDLEPEAILLPPFLFQPILENAVKHAFKDIDRPGLLEVSFQMLQADALLVEIRDNGPGYDPHKPKEGKSSHQSLGLKMVRDRIALLNAERKDDLARFEMINMTAAGGQGMLARFFIPLIKQDHGESSNH